MALLPIITRSVSLGLFGIELQQPVPCRWRRAFLEAKGAFDLNARYLIPAAPQPDHLPKQVDGTIPIASEHGFASLLIDAEPLHVCARLVLQAEQLVCL